MKGGLETLPGQAHSKALHVAALAALIAGALSLGFAGLVPVPVCLLSLMLIVIVGLVLPQWMPALVSDGPHRTATALGVLALLIVATALSGPGALFSGQLSGTLSTAVAELALPSGVPIGLLAALAAGALVAVALELGERRGVQSALVLGIAVLGLASVAAPGGHLLPGIVLGWPATMFALTQLAGTLTAGSIKQRLSGAAPEAVAVQMMRRTAPPSSPTGPNRLPRRVSARWHLLPVLTAITLSLSVLAALLLTGVGTIGERSRGWGGSAGQTATAGSRSTSDYLGGEMDMDARGDLGPEAVLEVEDSSPGLWRAGTLDQYTGRGWLTSDPPTPLPKLRYDGQVTATMTPPLADATGQIRTDRVRPARTEAPQVLAPGRLLSLTSTSLKAGASATVFAGDRVNLAFGRNTVSEYSVRSYVAPRVDDSAAASLLTADPPLPGTKGSGSSPMVDEELDPRWKALPESVPSRVRLLGERLVSQAPYRLAAVQSIEAELARRMTYSLNSPVPPPTVDAVDDVLFVSHSGFCEQFASAEVVLLRAAGVPARMAVGFSGGESGDDGFRTLRRADAHAWVEVWFPGVGWVTSDPTPAADATTTSWWQRAQARAKSFFSQASLSSAARIWVVLGVAVLLTLILIAAPWVWRRRARARIGDASLQALDPDLAAAFTRLEADLRAQGRPRAPSETVAELARRLGPKPDQEGSGETGLDGADLDPTLVHAMQVLERALYGSRPPSRQECLAAADAINHVGGRTPARSR
jgi:transglutaminase-like putative cysteine protease